MSWRENWTRTGQTGHGAFGLGQPYCGGLPEELDAAYKSFGIDLRQRHNTEKAELPIPATYVVAKDGTVTYVHLDVDYTYRAEPEEIIAALTDLK